MNYKLVSQLFISKVDKMRKRSKRKFELFPVIPFYFGSSWDCLSAAKISIPKDPGWIIRVLTIDDNQLGVGICHHSSGGIEATSIVVCKRCHASSGHVIAVTIEDELLRQFNLRSCTVWVTGDTPIVFFWGNDFALEVTDGDTHWDILESE